jgi:hypothetical protein
MILAVASAGSSGAKGDASARVASLARPAEVYLFTLSELQAGALSSIRKTFGSASFTIAVA